MLWTRSLLVSARNIYRAVGFELIEEHEGEENGRRVTDEIWSMSL
jgi:hypothetical protein